MRPRRLRILLTLLGPLALLLAIEGLLRTALWEPHAQPASHAGTSVRLKQALRAPIARHIDFVTLGSSRPEYGIDHAAWAARARERGYVHADLSMPGTHWMSIGVLVHWLAREHPEIRGGVIGLSIQDFTNAGNGTYELGIVQPLRTLADTPWIADHVPFQLHDAATWGTYSAMAEWRSDMRDYLANPVRREHAIDWYRQFVPPERVLFGNPDSNGDMCAAGSGRLDACDAIETSTDARLQRQCRELRSVASYRMDYAPFLHGASPPASLAHARDLVRGQLRAIPWTEPPVVLLMPVPSLVTRDVLGNGLHGWALAVLQPLVDEGRIRVLDATDLFAGDVDECSQFFDFYHQGASGRARLDAWLQPRLAPLLYGTSGAPP